MMVAFDLKRFVSKKTSGMVRGMGLSILYKANSPLAAEL
jgi:hypothetical protein